MPTSYRIAVGFIAIVLSFRIASVSADDFSIDFSWEGIARCSSTPPDIKLVNVPDDTARFQIKLVDLDFTAFNHGGGIAPYTGDDKIRESDYESEDYRGPCPPGDTHTYEFTVQALGEDGSVRAEARASGDFPHK